MEGNPKKPRKSETKEVSVNIAGLFVGVILFCSLIWSLWYRQMLFAYINAALLFALATGNHAINMMYK